ncbi:hypothetical protein GCM10027290_53550 [Micromonospora sonneratiae]|uniref:DUF4229 domain-containing protein n=1 Tax=Micromonospora sonneratiae TaxID=1184706 RepID=A0ABW3YGW3_9ACTN
MSAAAKYTLGRLGLFVVVVLALWPVDIDIFLKLILALVFSAALSFFLLRGWRDQMGQQMAEAADRRKAEKERLRSALAGTDDESAGVTAEDPSTKPDDGKPKRD